MKRIFAITLAFLLCAQPAFAALSIGATVTVLDQDGAADPWTGNHTTDANTAVLIAACHTSNNTDSFNGITFNSVAMTEFPTEEVGSGVTTSSIFYLVNPDIGTFAFSVDLTPGTDDGGCVFFNAIGANTATPLTGRQAQNTSGTAPSVTVTCPAGNIAFSVGGTESVRTVTVDGSQTTLMNADDGNGSYFASHEASAGASVALSYSWVGSTGFTHIGACINAAPPARRPTAPIIFQ